MALFTGKTTQNFSTISLALLTIGGCTERDARKVGLSDNGASQAQSEVLVKESGTLEQVMKKRFLGTIEEIKTGGQSGVDQACMRHAVDCDVKVGGWVPAFYTAEVYQDGAYLDKAQGIPSDLLERGEYIETTYENVASFIENVPVADRELLEPLFKKAKENPQDPSIRTELQVYTTDATLVITTDHPGLTDGTVIMEALAKKYGKPYYTITVSADDLISNAQISEAKSWVKENGVKSLNVGGPRASHQRDFGLDIEAIATELLEELLTVE